MKHLADLNLTFEQTIRLIQNMPNWCILEKIDGTHMSFGFDDHGNFFTRTYGNPVYDETHYPEHPFNNPHRAAHVVLDHICDRLWRVMGNNSEVEIEVVYSAQPNTIKYTYNCVVYLKILNGDFDIHQLPTRWPGGAPADKIYYTKFMPSNRWEDLKFDEVEVDDEPWYISTLSPLTINTKLTADDLVDAKHIFEKLYDEGSELAYKEIERLFFRRLVHDSLHNRGSQFALDPQPEGLVVFDPESQLTFKLVNKEHFTVINQFYHIIGNLFKATGPTYDFTSHYDDYKSINYPLLFTNGRSTNPVYNVMLVNNADTLGISRLGGYMTITKCLREMGGARGVAHAIPSGKRFASIKNEVLINISKAQQNLRELWYRFERDWSDFNVVLHSGETVKYLPHVCWNAEVVYISVSMELVELHEDVDMCTSKEQLVRALYKKQLRVIEQT